MSHGSKSSLTVALFPFLAVLICTMGALILLLMVVTMRQLRHGPAVPAVAEAAGATAPLPILSVESSSPPPAPEQIVIPAEPEVEPEPSEPAIDPRELIRAQREAALAQRERELEELLAEWRQKADQLASERDARAKTLAQRLRLKDVAVRQIATLQSEVKDLEVKLGSLTGELSASAMGDATAEDRKQIEQQMAALLKRLKAAQAAQAGGESKFMVVPFDTLSGTSRRPILIECTDEGLRFLPEGIMLTPADLEGFTPRVNPLLAGANSLVNYWTAWNLKQPQPAREPEPYVLMLVRPSGTVAYYVAVQMLASLKQPHGYELIEETTQLQMPELDAGAKAACEAAVRRLLSERKQIQQFSGGSGGTAFTRGGPSGGDAFRSHGGSTSRTRDSNRFELTDVVDEEREVGSNSWERIENFQGRGSSGTSVGRQESVGTGNPGSGSTQHRKGADAHELDSHDSQSTGDGSAVGDTGSTVARRPGMKETAGHESAAQIRQGSARPPGRVVSGIERIDGASGTMTVPGVAGESTDDQTLLSGTESRPGGSPSLPLDRRSKRVSVSPNQPFEPEQLVRRRWGLSEPGAAIGLEREVRIDVEPHRLVVAGKHAIQAGEAESQKEVFERLVTVLDLQAREWGSPPQGFFWTPHLKFVIASGGNPNYEKMHSLTERAGLSSTKEFASAEKDEKPARTPPRSTPKAPRLLRGAAP